MDDYLSKPLHLDRLAATLQRWLPEAAGRALEILERPDGNGHGQGVLDLEVWSHLHARDGAERAAVMDKFIDLFLGDSQFRLQTMRAALDSREVGLLAREAHALKAGSLQVGATAMVELCDTLQKEARSGTLEGSDAILSSLADEFRRAKQALAAERAKLT